MRQKVFTGLEFHNVQTIKKFRGKQIVRWAQNAFILFIHSQGEIKRIGILLIRITIKILGTFMVKLI